MIFYTLQGPIHCLEIHDDKIKLIKKNWMRFFSKKQMLEYKLSELTEFRVTSPKLITGRLEWSTLDGTKGCFRFSTNSVMMGKIEKYIHTRITKNNQSRSGDVA